MFMMYFVCPSYPFGIPIIYVSKQFEPLVYKNIMDQKVSGTINQYTKPQWPPVPKVGLGAQPKEGDAYRCVEQKKGIVSFKPGIVVLFMVILVQGP
jgi:hypothetical protein